MQNYNQEPHFIIGNMDEEVAKDFLNRGDGKRSVGIGFDDISAKEYVQVCPKYKLEDLAGCWAVDVWKWIKEGRVDELSDDVVCSLSHAVIDSVILEEVCHTVGYKHHDGEHESYMKKFFIMLVK